LFAVKTLTIAEASADLEAVLDRIVADKAPVKIACGKGEGVALVPRRVWDSAEETLYLLRSPANAARLLEAVRGLEAGEEKTTSCAI
jgi:antitoxin YefM